MVDGVESDVRWGPQPYEGYLSVVCEAFGCTPDIAERQHQPTVHRILEYRAARQAVDLFNGSPETRKILSQRPELQQLLIDMHRAQSGAEMTTDQLMEIAGDGDSS